jgi:aryl-alcohol dehydrogenase-like predicted oxidoreductase
LAFVLTFARMKMNDSAMPQVALGSAGLRVSAQGLGCMGMSHGYGTPNDAESRRVLARALELGVTFWDTADFYGNGLNEQLLAGMLRVRRADITLATKFGLITKPAPGERAVRGDAAYVTGACEASLRRLGIDVIDLYYMHRVDLTVPIEETVGAMAELVQAGKVRYLGLSEVTASELRRAHAVHPISAVQSEWSLWSRDVEQSVVPACRELGVGFVPYSPLGRGFLTGELPPPSELLESDVRRQQPRLQPDVLAHNRSLVETVEGVAASLGVPASQVALSWVHGRAERWGISVVPIPGTKRIEYLESNVAALSLHLPEDAEQQLQSIAGKVLGLRHPQFALTSAGGRA